MMGRQVEQEDAADPTRRDSFRSARECLKRLGLETFAVKMLPRVVLSDPVVHEDDGKMVLEGVAEVLQLDLSKDRDDFIHALQPGGQLEGTIGLYERNQSNGRLGNFDRAFISKLPSTVKWIAHTGVGYDKVDVLACKERGIGVSNTPGVLDDTPPSTCLYPRFEDSPRPSRACGQGIGRDPTLPRLHTTSRDAPSPSLG